MKRFPESLPHAAGYHFRAWLLAGLVAMTSLAVTIVAAAPVTYQVTKTTDTADGTCDADCSLREAVIAANANPGADTIVLPAGTYTLSLAGAGEDACATGDLDITDDLTISGADEATTIIDGGGIDRVLHIAPSGAALFNMSYVTIRNGDAGSNSGGGILNSQGDVTLQYCTITGNSAGGVGEGVLGLYGGGGGGIYNDAGSLTMTECTVSYNLASDDDAGLPMVGAIGGGICNGPGGALTMTDSSLVHNSANGFAGLANLSGEVSLSGCTIALNSAENSYYSMGGGIANYGLTGELSGEASATLTNCTITDNVGSGIIAMDASTTNLTNCTVSHNSASLLMTVGGIYAFPSTTTPVVNLKNTIVSDNSGDECDGTITSLGHNLASDDTCSLTGTDDQPSTDPLLGPLQDNGGLTLTRALLAGSPAIEGGDNSGCPSTDQRGEPRPTDGDGDLVAVCDIGAYEAAALPPFSDIAIEKQTNGYDADSAPGPYIPVGNAVNWTYDVTNTGDTLLSDIYVTDNQGVVVTCPATSLGAGESMTCTASGTARIGQYSNTATVYGAPVVGETVSDSDTSHYFGTSPAIDIEKATNGQDADAAPGPEIAVGDPVTWTYEVVNRGNVSLTGITVSDDQGAVVDCPHTALGPAESMTCTASGVAELGQYENLGSVTGYYGTTQVTDSDASHYLGVTRADLSITKTTDPVTAYPGDQITYGIVVTNLGPSEALGVQVTDVLPPAVDYELDTASCIEAPAGTLTCNLGNLAAGESSAFDIYVRVPPEAPATTIANTATVSSTEPLDPDSSNNSDTAATVLLGKADLAIHKFGKPDGKVQAGEELSYTVIVDNLGPGVAHSVVVSDVLQSNGSFDLVSVTSNRPGTCTPAAGGTHSQRLELTCVLDDDLEVKTPDTSGRWMLTVVVTANEPQSVNNVARVTGSDLDPDLSNNEAIVEHEITEVADLRVTKTAAGEIQVDGQEGLHFDIATPSTPFPENPNYATSPDHVTAGRRISYTISVSNTGPSAAQNVQVTELLPPGVTLYPGSLTLSQGTCNTGTPGLPPQELLCGLGTLAASASATISFQVVVDASVATGTVLENDVSVTADGPDPYNDDNQAHTLTTVSSRADLGISSKAIGEFAVDALAGVQGIFYLELYDEVTAGRQIRYEVTVENKGPSDALDVTVDDVSWLYMLFTFVGADGASCQPNTPGGNPGHLLCHLGTIPSGTAKTIIIYMLVDPRAPDYVSCWHDTSTTSSAPDPFSDDNFAHDDITVYNSADLSIRKTSEPWIVYAGEQIRYDISVVNNGPSFARILSVFDILPEGVDLEMSTEPVSCIQNGSLQCTWDFPEGLMPGETLEFSFYGRVAPDTLPGTISNYAELVTDPEFWNLLSYNNSDTAANSVRGKADLKIQKFGKPEGLVAAGEELTYTVIVDNLGTGYAHDVLLTDLLESSGTFELISVASSRDADCTPSTGIFTKELQLTCSLTDTLEVATTQPGTGRWVLTVIVQAAEAQDINNVAKVASSDYDPDLTNNEATAEHEITAVADLEVTKSAWGEVPVGCGELDLRENEVAAGGTLTYTLTITNHGPSTAEDVVVRDQPLPSVLEIEDVTPSKGNCDEGYMGAPNYLLTCNLGTLLADQSETVTIVARVPSSVPDGTPLVNVARAYSDMYDGNNANDVITNESVVTTWADLQVLKTQDPKIALPTQRVTYTITVTNQGPSDAEGLVVSDTLPVPMTDVSWECCASGDGECQVPPPPTCPQEPCPPLPDIDLYDLLNLPAGEHAVYTLGGTLGVWPCGPFTNTVELLPPQSMVYPEEDIDPCHENNTDFAVNDPLCDYDPLALKEYPGPDSPP